MDNFYSQIVPLQSLTDILNPAHYQDVPATWLIAMTDIQGSTKAIQEGRYKDVNALAAASITALLNVAERTEIPFIFGGDGATILIPASLRTKAEAALLGTQRLAKEQFGLDLRVGIVPVANALAAGYQVRVARLQVSENYQQAIFSGGGISYAERLLKAESTYWVQSSTIPPEADFSGFECRWNAVKTPYEETLALIIMGQGDSFAANQPIYADVLHQIEVIYGDRERRNPITLKNLKMAFSPRQLMTEARIRRRNTDWPTLFQMLRISFLVRIAMAFNIRNWQAYRPIMVGAMDTEKFDDTLRMIISGTTAQREKLTTYLEKQRRMGKLVFGIHSSQAALITCIVFDYWGRQVHFVDATNGGYALAAKAMKAQLETVATI